MCAGTQVGLPLLPPPGGLGLPCFALQGSVLSCALSPGGQVLGPSSKDWVCPLQQS